MSYNVLKRSLDISKTIIPIIFYHLILGDDNSARKMASLLIASTGTHSLGLVNCLWNDLVRKTQRSKFEICLSDFEIILSKTNIFVVSLIGSLLSL